MTEHLENLDEVEWKLRLAKQWPTKQEMTPYPLEECRKDVMQAACSV